MWAYKQQIKFKSGPTFKNNLSLAFKFEYLSPCPSVIPLLCVCVCALEIFLHVSIKRHMQDWMLKTTKSQFRKLKLPQGPCKSRIMKQ